MSIVLHNTTYIATAPAGRAGLTYHFRHCAAQCHLPAAVRMAEDKKGPRKGYIEACKLEVGDRMDWQPIVMRDGTQHIAQVTKVLPNDGIIAVKSVVQFDTPPTHVRAKATSG